MSGRTYQVWGIFLLMLMLLTDAYAQEASEGASVPMARARREGHLRQTDSLAHDTLDVRVPQPAESDTLSSHVPAAPDDRVLQQLAERLDTASVRFTLTEDSLMQLMAGRSKGRFVPDPKKALWLAMVIPGGGQIYNRKYWKLPLIYGGFMGCVYAMTWNNTMYRDYSQAYIDIMDSDENTKSYENFIPAHYDVNANITRLQELFRRKKNYYRRYRDLSMFCMMGVYALSIVDAYVDAELSSFDISRDLSLKVHPAVISEKYSAMRAQGCNTNSYGLQCSLFF